MKIVILARFFILLSLCFSCSNRTSSNDINAQNNEELIHNDEANNNNDVPQPTSNFKILALGDSYTIGERVCETCRFPEQLKDSLQNNIENSNYNLHIIARTGWTTSNLKNAILDENPSNDFDLVTLLIGVNNQYQGRPFSLYETEFPELVATAISLAKGEKNNVIVISIPDYAFTPFGKGNTSISQEIDLYNAFAQGYCATKQISYVNITDITRLGLENPNLVAIDNLHPSELAYSKFVERILPEAIIKLLD